MSQPSRPPLCRKALPNWVAIAAMAENRAIGNKGAIPWHLPADFKFFRETTTGHVLLMGRKTWDSIGRPLPKRETVVISQSTAAIAGATVFPSLEAMLEQFDPQGRTIYVAGGQTIYRQTLACCSQVLLTQVKGVFKADTYFPTFEESFTQRETLRSEPEFTIYRYSRPQ